MNSFIGWIGGKRQLRKEILARFPTDTPTRYIEVFGGAGWVLFGKEKTSKQMEVFNDVNGDLINLFRCVKYHREELQRELQWLLQSRELFFDFLAQLNAPGLTDIQRAARYFYIIKYSFGCDRRTFKTTTGHIAKATEYLAMVQERLEGVVLENLDFEHIIKTYDRPTALFYLDPPYMAAEHYYSHPFSMEDHQRLRGVLGQLKGRFILSYNSNPLVLQLYDGSGFHIEQLSRTETLSGAGKNKHPYNEVIIRNF